MGLGDTIGKVTGGVFDILGGGVDIPRASTSGAFPGLGELGDEFQKFLLSRLTSPVEGTQQFQLGSAALRDAVTTAGATQRQRISDAAQAGGYLDSGQTGAQLLSVGRGESEAFAAAIRDLILGLEDRRTADVLPFLSAGANENLGVASANIQAALGERGQNLGIVNTITAGLVDPRR